MEIATVPRARDAHAAKHAARWRSVGMACLAALIALSLFGVFGPRTETAEATAGGVRLEVLYPAITRSGLPAPLDLRISRVAGFAGPVSVRIGGDLFKRLDFQSWYPTPAAETAGPDGVVYEFDPPEGQTLRVWLDARTSPGQFFGGRSAGLVSVLDADGRPLVSVPYSVWVTP